VALYSDQHQAGSRDRHIGDSVLADFGFARAGALLCIAKDGPTTSIRPIALYVYQLARRGDPPTGVDAYRFFLQQVTPRHQGEIRILKE